jgi:hypothetical protein
MMNIQRQPPCALAAGNRYDTMKELRLLCKQTLVFYNFMFKVDAADKSRYRIHSNISDTCPWRLHASSITSDGTEETNTVEIKVFVGEYICDGHHGSTHHMYNFLNSARISFKQTPVASLSLIAQWTINFDDFSFAMQLLQMDSAIVGPY